jgi:uncharacterized membrane protein HdeD (DUF308 family)
MKKLKWTMIITDVILILLGVAFVWRPDIMESIMCYLLAALVALVGLMYLAGYFIQKSNENGEREGNGFAIGLLLIFIAAFIVVRQEVIIALVPFLFGFLVVIRGLMVIQGAFMIRRLRSNILIPIVSGLLSMALGLFIMLFPFETMQTLFILIGISLMVGGISGIVHEIMVWHLLRRDAQERERIRDMAVTARKEARKGHGDAAVDSDAVVIDVEPEPAADDAAEAEDAVADEAVDVADEVAADDAAEDAKAGNAKAGNDGEDLN